MDFADCLKAAAKQTGMFTIEGALVDHITPLVNHPKHYNTHSIECIEFARYLGFNTGNVFKYLWRLGKKDATPLEEGKIKWYTRDTLAHRVGETLDAETADRLIRVLSNIAEEFDPDVFVFLVALIDAASGDYELLFELAVEREYFTARELLMYSNR